MYLELIADQTSGSCQKFFFKVELCISKRTVAKSKQIENHKEVFSFEYK